MHRHDLRSAKKYASRLAKDRGVRAWYPEELQKFITLIAETPVIGDVERASSAFATPTIVHFASVRLLSAVISAPWHAFAGPALFWGVLGSVRILYEVIVTRRMRVQTAYRPELEDWLFHVLLPFAAYAIVVVSAYVAHAHPREALFCVGAAALLLLVIGIHKAWDAVPRVCQQGPTRRGHVREGISRMSESGNKLRNNRTLKIPLVTKNTPALGFRSVASKHQSELGHDAVPAGDAPSRSIEQ